MCNSMAEVGAWRRWRDAVAIAIAAFVVLLACIAHQPIRRLNHFDQSFYLTLAYDLSHHGVFSNGIFDDVVSTRAVPPPGMFFGPAYPALLVAVAYASPRFAEALRCSVEANENTRDSAGCEDFAWPMHVVHAALLALGVLAIATAGALLLPGAGLFWPTGALATVALAFETWLFSFLMTESLQVGLICMFLLALAWTLRSARPSAFATIGLVAGLLCLAKPSYVVLLPAVVIIAVAARWLLPRRRPSALGLLCFVVAAALVIGPWLARNAIILGKPRLTEEYGAVSLVERFAFNTMSFGEGVLALPYCLPAIGPAAFDALGLKSLTARFEWDQPGSFFQIGRARRNELVATHGRLDPLLGDLLRAEFAAGWWRPILSSLPLAWCGAWVAQTWSLAALPLFLWACVRVPRRSRRLLLLYAAPTVVMLGLHAAVANHYPRYNLGLIAPFSIGAGWVLTVRLRRRPPAAALSAPPPAGRCAVPTR